MTVKKANVDVTSTINWINLDISDNTNKKITVKIDNNELKTNCNDE